MGKELIHTVVEATGLPQDPVHRELKSLLTANGKSMDNLSLEDLREVMAEYLQSVFVELKESHN